MICIRGDPAKNAGEHIEGRNISRTHRVASANSPGTSNRRAALSTRGSFWNETRQIPSELCPHAHPVSVLNLVRAESKKKRRKDFTSASGHTI